MLGREKSRKFEKIVRQLLFPRNHLKVRILTLGCTRERGGGGVLDEVSLRIF